ncbi:hypothetical protein MYCTH_2301019 [Thermothelomyces thermophilus ATCC 42464]|uniref:Uncharacterized protein n=1 Tax=Thermothelomyces thermophilus (strain ATCC 42464 / BCRC 31852 / DSM 1799) TaxID=573729 RepID=G2Q8T1_THET4|nr:uncharacterized protein MYCTH_2301019 [Thermothelomyces thermophilus ATCC 42464]AEO56276.1 hypothetical protein MYCTH_2301019 [Thermothelomyces thermophilus ATCC 42464]
MSQRWPADPAYDDPYARNRAPPMEPASNASYTHSRTRTTSSNTFPAGMQGPPFQPNPYQPPMHLAQPPVNHQRRSASVNTFSTVSSGGMVPPAAYRTSPTLEVRRSTSSRSGGATGSPQPSYVALLRKQKATVWCDRAQHEDPRLQAQQRAAKMRAYREIAGASSGLGLGLVGTGRTATGLSSAGGKVAAKIRHHGKPTVIGYSPNSDFNGVGGVPLRLSATEVEGEESDEDDAAIQRQNHRRTGSSGRNSTSSARRAMPYRSSGGLGPAGGATKWSPGGTPDRTGSLVGIKSSDQSPPADDAASGTAKSFGSGSSNERLDNVPELNGASSHLANNSKRNATVAREKSVKSVEELKRRGSVDERTMTLTAGRLYIANPD